MITAIIRNRENTLVLDFPRSIYASMKSCNLSAL